MTGIYTSSDGEQHDVKTLNSFRLVNGLVKSVKEMVADDHNELAKMNVQTLQAEILERLDTRTAEERKAQ